MAEVLAPGHEVMVEEQPDGNEKHRCVHCGAVSYGKPLEGRCQ